MLVGRNPSDPGRASKLHSMGRGVTDSGTEESEFLPLCVETGLSGSAQRKVEVRSWEWRVRKYKRGTEGQKELECLKGMPWATQDGCLRSSLKDLLPLLTVAREQIPHLELPSLPPNAGKP